MAELEKKAEEGARALHAVSAMAAETEAAAAHAQALGGAGEGELRAAAAEVPPHLIKSVLHCACCAARACRLPRSSTAADLHACTEKTLVLPDGDQHARAMHGSRAVDSMQGAGFHTGHSVKGARVHAVGSP